MAKRRMRASPVEDEGIVNERALTQDRGISLWKEASKRVESGRNRMREAEQITLGKIKLTPPGHLTRQNQDITRLIPTLPQRKSLVLAVTNTLAEERPTIHRQKPPKGGTTSEMRAEETETALNAMLLKLFPWSESVARSVQQGNYLVVTLLAEDMWDHDLDYLEELAEDAWEKLDKKDKATYTRVEGGKGEKPRYERPREKYWRDRNDRGPEHKDYTRRSPEKTKAAYLEDLEEQLAQNPPFAIRCYSAFDFAPIRDAEGLQGAVVRQLMEPSALVRKGYRSKGLEEVTRGKVLIPTGVDQNIWGKDGKIFLYHFYLWIDGDPCVAYMVGGQDTDVVIEGGDGKEDRVHAFVNLREKWGFSRLPIGDYYGLRLEGVDDLGEQPVPFMDPIGPALVAAEGALGAANITGWRRGTSKYTVQPAPNIPTSAYIEASTGALKQLDLDQEGDIVTVYGPVGTLGPLQQSEQSLVVADKYLAAVGEASPDSAAFGGSGAESGRQMALMHSYMQSANRMIPEGLRQAYEDAASFILEWGCCFMREKGIREIPYYTSEEADPQEGGDEAGEKTVVVRLVEQWIGKNYRVKAEVAAIPNPVLVEQEVSLSEKGYGSFEDVQKARGKRNVLQARVKAINDAYWRSEKGQAELSMIDAKARGDMEKARQYAAFLRQDAAPMEMGPNGQVAQYGPADALDPMFEQPTAGGGPTSAQAARAGTIGAGRGAEMQDLQAAAGMAGGGIGTAASPAPGMRMG